MNAGFGKSMDITLMGLEFRIVCADDEHDELLEAIGYLEKKCVKSGIVAESSVQSG